MTAEGFSDTTVRALAHELKYPLVEIARHAELIADKQAAGEIQSTAEQTLRLIDSYLLCAQAEYGQLALEPVTAGSALYDVSMRLRNIEMPIVIDDRAHAPVMTHSGALTACLELCARTLVSSVGVTSVRLKSFNDRSGRIGIGVLVDANIQQDDFTQAIMRAGKSHMPLARVASRGQVSLTVADTLSKAIGSSLQVKKLGKLHGFITYLPKSEQMALF
jgi:hypothetical protein